MRPDNTKILIEALSLIMADGATENLKLARSVLGMTDESLRSNPATDSTLVNFYQRFIGACLNDEADPTSSKDRLDILFQLKGHPVFTETPGMYDQMVTSLGGDNSISERKAQNIRKRLQSYMIFQQQRIHLNRAMAFNAASMRATDPVNRDLLMGEVENCARQILGLRRDLVDDFTPLEEVDLTDVASVLRARKKYDQANSTDSVMRTGLQGLNEMMDGGPRYGEFAVIGGLSGNYKSGLLQEMTRWIPVYNAPPPVPAGYKPLVLQISLENTVTQNNDLTNQRWYVQVHKQLPPPDMTSEELGQLSAEYFEAFGWSIKLVPKAADEFSFEDFLELVDDYRAKGLWVMVVVLDYASIMDWTRCEGGNDAAKIQKLVRKLANFARHNGVYLITGAQLDANANRIAETKALRGQVYHFGISMLADCKSIFKEADFFAFIHLESNHLNDRYLTLRWRKHRYHTPPKDQFVAYKFHDKLGLLDDINGESEAVHDIYAVTSGESEDEFDEVIGF